MDTATTCAPVDIEDIANLDLVAIDPYNRATRGRPSIELVIRPGDRHAALSLRSGEQATSMDQAFRRVLHVEVEPADGEIGEIDGERIVAALRTPEWQAELAAICDGHTVEWDGNSRVGRLTAAAEAALERLAAWLARASTTDFLLCDPADYYEPSGRRYTARRLGLARSSSDASIEGMLDAEIAEARANKAILLRDELRLYLQCLRDEIASEDDAGEER